MEPSPFANKNITDAQLRAALRESAGVMSVAAKKLGCERSNVAQRVARSPELQALLKQIDHEIEELADSVIISTLGERDITGKPTKEARLMSRWMKDYRQRVKGLQARVKVNTPEGGGSAVTVLIEYVDGAQDEPGEVV